MENRRNPLAIAIPFIFLLIIAPGTFATDEIPYQTLDSDEETDDVSDNPFTLWTLVSWFMETTRNFMDSISTKSEAWFGIDQSVMILFFLVIFLLAIRYKANGWMFWFLILVIMFLVANGSIPLENYI